MSKRSRTAHRRQGWMKRAHDLKRFELLVDEFLPIPPEVWSGEIDGPHPSNLERHRVVDGCMAVYYMRRHLTIGKICGVVFIYQEGAKAFEDYTAEALAMSKRDAGLSLDRFVARRLAYRALADGLRTAR